MFGFTVSEQLFYGGMICMLAALGIGALCAVLFSISAKKIKKKLEEEYGKAWKQGERQDVPKDSRII